MLSTLINHKRIEIQERETQVPLSQFIGQITASDRDFKNAVSQNGMRFILECKKASPSAGLINPNYNLTAIAKSYSPFADAISVLTDSRFFQGRLADLRTVRKTVSQPLLCKDFFISAYQVYEARFYGADAILLMLSVLDDQTYVKLATIARQFNMAVLTEVHDSIELQRAIDLKAEIIGINNRDLQTLEIDLNTTKNLAGLIPDDRIIISESGYHDHHELRAVKNLVNGFLIGSSLMKAENLDLALRELLFGRIKICGLRDQRQINLAFQNGARYAGLNFVDSSPRKIASTFQIDSAIELVGIFQDQTIDFILERVREFNLKIVQLHGDESISFIHSLRSQLENSIAIWKATTIDDFMPSPLIDRYLFDSRSNGKFGGSGKTFNWDQLPEVSQDQFILAGGLNLENINEAMNCNCWAYDLNSGLEYVEGSKDPEKITQLFKRIRGIE